MKLKTALSAALTACAILSTGPVAAQGLPDNILHAELREGWRTSGGTQMAALHLTLAPGWKTYWRAPGEGGIPPSFDWAGSQNIADVAFHWPKPQVFDLNGMRVIGYRNELVLPMEFTAVDPSRPMTAMAEVELGVCEEICVPMSLSINAAFDGSSQPDPMIEAALAQRPESSGAAGLSSARCEAEAIRDGLRVTASMAIPPVGPDEFAVVELADRSVWISAADTRRQGGALTATADMVPPAAQPFALDRSSVRITIFGGSGRVVEVQGCTG
ncbi:MAG: protein-disulfide reductase DsbD domain-containing protein [Albidovulum sp.]|uniref:protein-disulfide reductase DsbD domain-containing protein n=1 Tax=Albidovulum sp. TaxID=1872424 RepID=UPI003C7F2E13